MNRYMDWAAVGLAVSVAELAEACKLARGVDLVGDDDSRAPLMGAVPSDPPHVVHIGRFWGSAFRCTCGSRSKEDSSLARLCVHAAALLVRWIADRSADPEATITAFHDDAAPFGNLERARDAVIDRALRRDLDGSDLMNYADAGLENVGLKLAPLCVNDWFFAKASSAQIERFLVDKVTWLLGEGGEGSLDPRSAPAMTEASDLLFTVAQSHPTASFAARLQALKRIRSTFEKSTWDGSIVSQCIDWAGRLLPNAAPVGSALRQELVTTLVGLEERYPRPRYPFMPMVISHWDDDLRELAMEGVECRIGHLLALLDVDAVSADEPGSFLSSSDVPFLLDIDPIGENVFIEHRYPDAGRPSIDPVCERIERMQRLAADLAFRRRELHGIDRALRRWSGATFAEFFYRARRWSPAAQLVIARAASDRGAVRWAPGAGALLAEFEDSPYFPGGGDDVSDVVEIYAREPSTQRLQILTVEEIVCDLARGGLTDAAKEFLVQQLRHQPDPRCAAIFVQCWEGNGLPGDAVEAATRVLRGDPPG